MTQRTRFVFVVISYQGLQGEVISNRFIKFAYEDDCTYKNIMNVLERRIGIKDIKMVNIIFFNANDFHDFAEGSTIIEV